MMLLCGSILLVAVGSLGFVLGDSLLVYFPARTLMGLGSGGIWIGVTFETLDRCPGEEYRCMSRVFAAYSAGGLIGPALGALGGVRWPFLAYLVVLLLALPACCSSGTRPGGASSQAIVPRCASARSGPRRRRSCSPS